MQNCCQQNDKSKKGFWQGIIYGIFPHTFCILFIIFSIIGATGATLVTKNILLIPHFFSFLFIISFLFATFSALIYLKKTDCCTLVKISTKWKYLLILYTATISTNVLFIFYIFPAVANFQPQIAIAQENQYQVINISVDIPCPGHAPLIMDEVKKDDGVIGINFEMPNNFKITIDPEKTSVGKIATMEIFKQFKLTQKTN